MTLRYFPLLFLLLAARLAAAQTDSTHWDLERCVEYALKNNISVRQADLQVRFAQVDFLQSKAALYPTANFNGNVGFSSGRNQDPTTYGLTTVSYTFNQYSLQASVDLFNWFSKKNNIAVKALNIESGMLAAEKARNDVALNVAAAYLQGLLAYEQVNVAAVQVQQTASQLDRTRKQVDAGALPELNAVQLESQLATDSANLVTAQSNANLAILQMKALLNLDAAANFDIARPPVESIPVDPIAELQPDVVYQLAVANQPQQKADEVNIKAAKKSIEVARAQRYPTFSLFGSLGTTFNNKAQEVKSVSQANIPLGTVQVGATNYQVYPINPYPVYSYGKIDYFNQLNQNFRQSIGIGVGIPILNGGTLRSAWQRSKLNLDQAELTKEQNSLSLKQDIYRAYNDAMAALQKFNANQKAVDAAQKAAEFAQKRYDVNLLSTYDLINSQNSLQTARIQLLYAQYDYVFKMKVLEFYKGQGLKL